MLKVSAPMIAALLAPLALAQASAQSPGGPIPVIEPGRMAACVEQAQIDPAGAILTAELWLEQSEGAQQALPRQCIGFAYISQLRWGEAETAFLAARELLPDSLPSHRARLAAMAGNAALAGENHASALRDFELASADAAPLGNAAFSSEIALDRARALAGLERLDEADIILAEARAGAPDNPGVWLLSATLARRTEALGDAREYIEAASTLTPADPAIMLEAGLIALLQGRESDARQQWAAILASSPQSEEGRAALYYLTQLDELQEQP